MKKILQNFGNAICNITFVKYWAENALLCLTGKDSHTGFTMVQATQNLLHLSDFLLHNIYKLLI